MTKLSMICFASKSLGDLDTGMIQNPSATVDNADLRGDIFQVNKMPSGYHEMVMDV